jgi:hypothetical protein
MMQEKLLSMVAFGVITNAFSSQSAGVVMKRDFTHDVRLTYHKFIRLHIDG